MGDSLRLSPQTVLVLGALLEAPKTWRYGYDISRDTGVKSGTLYPILMRLADHELVETTWEATEDGRPPRHMYRLTPDGVRSARAQLRSYAQRQSPRPTLREARS
jgi:PadR family transcriptional regulator, regulatory protein PadR